jgi:hypothetical protein
VIAVSSRVELALVPAVNPGTTGPAEFDDCGRPNLSAAAAGVYLLVMSPAAGFAEMAPMRSVGVPTGQMSCGRAYAIDGVQFRLEYIDVQTIAAAGPGIAAEISSNGTTTPANAAAASKLRNLIAHLFFGTEMRNAAWRDPFEATADIRPDAALDMLRRNGRLTLCDVPLAAIFWTPARLHFIDMHAVRRRPMIGAPDEEPATNWAGRYPGLGESILLQFQEHLSELDRANGGVSSLAASQYFRYLPALALVPIGSAALRLEGRRLIGALGLSGALGNLVLASQPAPVSISYPTGPDLRFFANIPYRGPVFIEGDEVEALIRESLPYAPIDTASGEGLWIYRVRENADASAADAREYVIFAHGRIRYRANARFHLSRFNFSNYASI